VVPWVTVSFFGQHDTAVLCVLHADSYTPGTVRQCVRVASPCVLHAPAGPIALRQDDQAAGSQDSACSRDTLKPGQTNRVHRGQTAGPQALQRPAHPPREALQSVVLSSRSRRLESPALRNVLLHACLRLRACVGARARGGVRARFATTSKLASSNGSLVTRFRSCTTNEFSWHRQVQLDTWHTTWSMTHGTGIQWATRATAHKHERVTAFRVFPYAQNFSPQTSPSSTYRAARPRACGFRRSSASFIPTPTTRPICRSVG
jgi:hypothetical protein